MRDVLVSTVHFTEFVSFRPSLGAVAPLREPLAKTFVPSSEIALRPFQQRLLRHPIYSSIAGA